MSKQGTEAEVVETPEMKDKELQEAVASQAAKDKVVEEEVLDESILGLPEDQQLLIYARERHNYALAYHTMKSQIVPVRATININEASGNTKVAKEYQDIEQNIDVKMKHILRAVKLIDKQFPQARAKMVEMIKRGQNGRNQ